MPARGIDLLTVPVVGTFLRWRHARTVLQVTTFGLAVLVMVDGWWGPDVAPLNLGGILPWVHWRGFVVLALLGLGNLFCMACPFMLVRRPAKRWFRPRRSWPRALRSKWTAIGLLVLFFWAYEAFDLWASPWLTAWIAATYFLAAFAVDAVFRGAAFCKYLCPIGHFHFVGSTQSPFEVAVRDPGRCASCTTKDCIRGRWEDPARKTNLLQNGCELWLFQQRKHGNMDCTFCLECVHACPHDNVGLLSRRPSAELVGDRWRSGVGRLSQRPDVAALIVMLTFAAFVNAFGMVTPALQLLARLADIPGLGREPVALAAVFGLGLVVVPFLLVSLATAWTARVTRDRRPRAELAARWAPALAPVGFGMWTAHYLIHFLMAGGTLLPVLQGRFALGSAGAHPASHATPGMVHPSLVPEAWIYPIALLTLQVGMLVSVTLAYRIGTRELGERGRPLAAALPWILLAVGLAAAGAWVMAQPMDMRGMMA